MGNIGQLKGILGFSDGETRPELCKDLGRVFSMREQPMSRSQSRNQLCTIVRKVSKGQEMRSDPDRTDPTELGFL